MSAVSAIGFFDSGIGGLSVLRHAVAAVDGIPLLYVADSAHAPYGAKDPDSVRARCRQITRFLIAQGAGAIVVACNTATAVAVEQLRDEFALPIIAMEPAVKPAAAVTRSGQIAVLATRGTLGSDRYARLLSDHGRQITIHERVCHHWVEAVESGELDTPRVFDLVNAELAPLHRIGVDTYVLGCTHFPFLLPTIRRIVGEATQLIDPGPAVIEQLRHRLALGSTVVPEASSVSAFSSGPTAVLQQQLRDLLGRTVEVQSLPV